VSLDPPPPASSDFGTWESALTTAELAAIRSAGFLAVGRVLGAAVYDAGFTGDSRCPGTQGSHGVRSRGYGTAQTEVSSLSSPDGSFAALVRAMHQARRAAIDHMAVQCSALGGHGVVGIQMTIGSTPAGATSPVTGAELVQLTAIGTAVRAPGAAYLDHPFTTDLSGHDFAKLITRGWVPAGLVTGIAIGARHDDSTTRDETARYAGNTEIGGHTHLMNATRHNARRELAQDVRRLGAEGVVVTSMRLRARERRCPASGDARDHVVEATTTGTARARFTLAEAAGPGLAIMRLRPRRQSEAVTFGRDRPSEKMR
jgi:uncharacterized protein YbjQ (UPF0145 family)